MIIEILDHKGRPIGAMDYSLIHSQNLNHYKVLVVPYMEDQKICLIKLNPRSPSQDSVWDLPVNTHVPAYASREETALKTLEYNLGLKIYPLNTFMRIFWKEENEFLCIYMGRCTNRPILSKNPQIEDITIFQISDLEFLMSKYPNLFSKELHYLMEQRIIQDI